MQLLSISEHTRTIEKSIAERSRFVVLRRAQAQTTHELFLNINELARWRHEVRPVGCCENPCADNPLGPRPCRRLLSCRTNSLCAGPEPFVELRRLDQARDSLRDCSLIAQKCAHRVEHFCGMKCRLK
jgi:hypothetical protein